MIINKEQFREFEQDRFVWMGAEEPAQAEAPKPKVETTDTKEIATEEEAETEAEEATEEATAEGDVATATAEADPEATEISISKAIYSDPQTRFALMKFMGISNENADAMTQEDFTQALQENEKLKPLLDIASEAGFKLDKDGREKLGEAFAEANDLENVSPADPMELKLLKSLNVTDKLGKEGLYLLSMTHEIRKEGKEIQIKLGKGEDDWKELTEDNATKALNGEIQKEVGGGEKLPNEKFKETVIGKIKTLRTALDLKKEIINNTEGASKGMSTMQLVQMVMQMLPMLQAALSGDTNAMKDLMDGWNHYKETGELPMAAMSNAKEYYANEVKDMPIKELLALHGNPRSEMANQRFFTPKGPMKFRGKLTEAIQEKIAASLGGGKLQMTNASEGGTDMMLTQSGRTFNIRLSISPDGSNAMDISEATGVDSGKKPTNVEYDIKFADLGKMGEEFNSFRVRKPAVPNPASSTESA